MENYNVLIFPAGTEIANEVISSLKNHKYFKIFFASSEEMSYCNYRTNNIDYIPYVTNKLFQNTLNEIIELRKIDFIIPAHDDVARKLSQIENNLKAKVIGQNEEITNIVRFKDETYKFFKDLVPVPITYNQINNDNGIFPLYLKPNNGYGARDNFLVKDYEQFLAVTNSIDIEKYVISEYLPYDEFTIDCFSDKGNVLYFGSRTREKTTRGISIQSTYISDIALNKEFEKYAKIISANLNMHGVWFYQMKFDKNKELKLLEIGPRVSGTMMLNRARGINFVELALYQKLGCDVEVIVNNIEVSLARALVPVYRHNIKYENLYIDFDDTLFLEEKFINAELMKLIFQAKNDDKKVYLITKNKKFNLIKILHKFCIVNLFDEIIHIHENEKKIDYMKLNSVLIDDSFAERKEAINSGIPSFGIDNINIFIKD